MISSLTLEQLAAAGGRKDKRGYWVMESRWPHALDVSLDEDRSRVRNPNAALVLGLFRRWVVSVAQTALAQVQTKKTRWRVRRSEQRFAQRDGGPARRRALVFAPSPSSRRSPN